MEVSNFPGLFQRLGTEETQPHTKAPFIDLLKRDGDGRASWVKAHSKEREMHQGGQMMLIERFLGIVPHLTREPPGSCLCKPAARLRSKL